MTAPPILDLPSPNHDARPDLPISILVLHYTGMTSAQAAIDRLRDPAARVSSHYVVDEDGTIMRLVPEARRAWHAGISYWRGQRELNAISIGIEIVNPGHEWGYRPFPSAQMTAVRALCGDILSRHPIAHRDIVAHSDIAPDRKQDPGELFDWASLAADGIGLWPPGNDPRTHDIVTDAHRLKPIRAALHAIGYDLENEGDADPSFANVISAFQRHWRQEAITGDADAGTRARIAAVHQAIS